MCVTLAWFSVSSNIFIETTGTSEDVFMTVETTGGRPALLYGFMRLMYMEMRYAQGRTEYKKKRKE